MIRIVSEYPDLRNCTPHFMGRVCRAPSTRPAHRVRRWSRRNARSLPDCCARPHAPIRVVARSACPRCRTCGCRKRVRVSVTVLDVGFWTCLRGVGARTLTWPCRVGRRQCGSGCLAVLVDESAAGGVSSDRSAGPILDNFRIVRCALFKTAMRSVRVVVLDVLA